MRDDISSYTHAILVDVDDGIGDPISIVELLETTGIADSVIADLKEQVADLEDQLDMALNMVYSELNEARSITSRRQAYTKYGWVVDIVDFDLKRLTTNEIRDLLIRKMTVQIRRHFDQTKYVG